MRTKNTLLKNEIVSYWCMVDKAGTSLDTDTSAVITTEKLRKGDTGRL
jgi:hypothetical protein